jgi:membrane-bound lytic murein transglycosylase F
LLAVGFVIGCIRSHEPVLPDFPQIQTEGKLNVLTLSGSMNYFLYKGEPKGYEYELLADFAQTYHLQLNIHVVDNEAQLIEKLLAGESDLIAYNLPETNEGKADLRYCGRTVINHQVLVQRSNRGDTILKDVPELIGKEMWVMHDSKYYRRLVHLNEELGGGIHIRTVDADTISEEDLIEMVAQGKIPYTVCNRDIAKLNKTYFHNLNIALPVSHPQRSSWAVRKNSPGLAAVINQWFKENSETQRYQGIMKRYFEMSKMPGDEPAPILNPHQISRFDSIFKESALQLGWDWRLLASIAFQESKFYTDRVSWAGATGLMGLMPKTAKAFGLSPDSLSDPAGSVRAATLLLKRLNRTFSPVKDDNERIKFILAAYNAGAGHIHDAQALAGKYGKNPAVWENNVEDYLKLKSHPEYYNDPVVKQGYCRATETVNYVRSVMERWQYYQEKVK